MVHFFHGGRVRVGYFRRTLVSHDPGRWRGNGLPATARTGCVSDRVPRLGGGTAVEEDQSSGIGDRKAQSKNSGATERFRSPTGAGPTPLEGLPGRVATPTCGWIEVANFDERALYK